MSNKKLTILGIIAVVMIALTIIQASFEDRPVKSSNLSMPLIQGLDTKEIAIIELGGSPETITLKKVGKQFAVVNKNNYLAALEKINLLITSSLDIKIDELVTDNPSNHGDLGLTDETANSAVRFLNAKGDLIAGLLAGKDSELAGGKYVRLISGDREVSKKAYLSMNVPLLDTTALGYINKELVMVDKGNIAKVMVSGPRGAYTISDKDGKILLENVPEGKKLKGEDHEQVFSAITNLTFADVHKEKGDFSKLIFNKSYLAELKDSTVFTFHLAEKNEKTYVKCSSVFTDKSPVRMKRGTVESDEELKKKEAKLLARDASKKFNERHRGWIYEIPTWKALNMTKDFQDLLE